MEVADELGCEWLYELSGQQWFRFYTNNNPAIYWGLFDSQHYDEPTINGCSLGTERKFYFYFFSPLAPLRGKLLNLNPEPLLQQFGALLSNVHRCTSLGH